MGQKSNKRPDCVLGFYHVVEQPSGEMSGGVLVTSHLGRPVEFQCTLPIKPNATQKTLYGASLRPFLMGELIAGALNDRLQVKPDLVFVNQAEASNHSGWGGLPVFSCIEPESESLTQEFRGETYSVSAQGENELAKIIAKMTEHIPESADLEEPLFRVEQALKEALGQAA